VKSRQTIIIVLAITTFIACSCNLSQSLVPESTPTATAFRIPTSTSTLTLSPSAQATILPVETKEGQMVILPENTTTPIPVLAGWDYFNGHFYRLTEYLTWENAESQAERWGGTLVTIDDAAEGSWLREHFSAASDYWIGYNDITQEGKWVWASGSISLYTNWCDGEPSNSGGQFEPEDAAVMNYVEDEKSLDCWNDIKTDAEVRGIVEKAAP
jgi:hypothetical protein